MYYNVVMYDYEMCFVIQGERGYNMKWIFYYGPEDENNEDESDNDDSWFDDRDTYGGPL